MWSKWDAPTIDTLLSSLTEQQRAVLQFSVTYEVTTAGVKSLGLEDRESYFIALEEALRDAKAALIKQGSTDIRALSFQEQDRTWEGKVYKPPAKKERLKRFGQDRTRSKEREDDWTPEVMARIQQRRAYQNKFYQKRKAAKQAALDELIRQQAAKPLDQAAFDALKQVEKWLVQAQQRTPHAQAMQNLTSKNDPPK